MLQSWRDRLEASYPAAVLRRFFDLELLDRSFGLAAQAFVAMLPIIIVIVSVFAADRAQTLTDAVGDRFGLDQVARQAIRALFDTSGAEMTVSWLAVAVTLLSAFSLSRRLARVYAAIFEVPPLPRRQTWHGLVWIVVQVVLFTSTSFLRDVRRDAGPWLAVLIVVVAVIVWFLLDAASIALLVPAAARSLVLASAAMSSFGRMLVTAWAALYMPASLSDQAAQYGPIGVTFALFTYILVGVIMYLVAPLLVTTWVQWRRESPAATPAAAVSGDQ